MDLLHHPRTRALLVCASMFLLGAIFLLVWFGTSPQERVAESQRKFLQAVAEKNWSGTKSFLAPDYADRFGHRSETLLTDLRGVAQHFFVWNINSQGVRVKMLDAQQATVTSSLTLSGNGAGLTDFIMQEANKLPDPWVFTWKKTGPFPWSWQLENVDNPGLNIDAYRAASRFGVLLKMDSGNRLAIEKN